MAALSSVRARCRRSVPAAFETKLPLARDPQSPARSPHRTNAATGSSGLRRTKNLECRYQSESPARFLFIRGVIKSASQQLWSG